jgi:hypothetical protein
MTQHASFIQTQVYFADGFGIIFAGFAFHDQSQNISFRFSPTCASVYCIGFLNLYKINSLHLVSVLTRSQVFLKVPTGRPHTNCVQTSIKTWDKRRSLASFVIQTRVRTPK